LELSLKTLKESYHILEKEERELITIRPIKINNPLLCYDDIINEIIKIHNSEDNLNKYILENVNLNVCIDLINDNNKNISLIDYNNYKKRYNELKYILNDI